MQPYAVWHSEPVVVTSTFRGMRAERDYLHDRIPVGAENVWSTRQED